MLPVSPFAKRAVSLIDLTELAVDGSEAQAVALCQKAVGLPVLVAAVCLRPAYMKAARLVLGQSGIKLATVINFPDAQRDATAVGLDTGAAAQAAATAQAVADGADEIDLVFAWGAFQQGREAEAFVCVSAVKQACGPAKLKVILESGAFSDMAQLARACDGVIDAGADMLKTSTGFYPTGATPAAAHVLCEASRRYSKAVGVKISGGVRTAEQAKEYIGIAEDVLGLGWVQPDHFRIGASKLLDALLAPATSAPVAAGY